MRSTFTIEAMRPPSTGGGVPRPEVLLAVFNLLQKPARLRRAGGFDRAADEVDVLAALQLQMLVLPQVHPAPDGQMDMVNVPSDSGVGVAVAGQRASGG